MVLRPKYRAPPGAALALHSSIMMNWRAMKVEFRAQIRGAILLICFLRHSRKPSVIASLTTARATSFSVISALAGGSMDAPVTMTAASDSALAFALMFFGGGPIAIDHVLRGGGRGASNRS